MNNATDFFNNMIGGMGNNLNCMMLGKITSYNTKENTATIEPLHIVPKQNIPYQPLINVPIGYFNMGGYNIKVKPKLNDVVMLLFCDYDLDNILISGQVKTPNTDRTHALEDCVVLPLSINFLNSSYNATEDLTINKEGTSTYIKIKKDGEIVINSSKIKLGENATKRVLIESGNSYTTCNNVYAE